MKRIIILSLITFFAISSFAQAQHMSWSRAKMQGQRTGVKSTNAENVNADMGRIEGNKYIAPNGRIFKKNHGVTYDVAKAMLDAQPAMKEVKTVIAKSKKAMSKKRPESALSDWFIDELMQACAEETGKKIDVGIANFGGIRVDMPKGNVLLDDIISMFPFRNTICYVGLKGKDLRAILESMAAHNFEVLGGVRCVAKGGKLIDAEIDGKPIDDEKVYGVCTISFLLSGGDGIYVAKNAVELIDTGKYIMDVMIERVKRLTAEGKMIDYNTDGRVKILD